MSDITTGRTDSNMRFLWVNAPTVTEALMHLAAALRVADLDDHVIGLSFTVDSDDSDDSWMPRFTVGAYTEEMGD